MAHVLIFMADTHAAVVLSNYLQAFEGRTFAVTIVTTLCEAESVIARAAPPIDSCMIERWPEPGMDGIVVIARLRQCCEQIEILMLGRDDDLADWVRAYQAGVSHSRANRA